MLIFVADETWRSGLVRSLCALATTALLLGSAYALWGHGIAKGIAFTTTARSALDYQSIPFMLGQIGRDIGIIAALGIVGAVLTMRSQHARARLVPVVLLVGAATLPLSQLRIHEYVSLDKHTAWSALFLAPLAGRSLSIRVRNRPLVALALFLAAWSVFVVGLSRSLVQYHGWPDARAVAEAVTRTSRAGVLMSLDADSLNYYTSQDGSKIQWETGYILYQDPAGHAAINRAVQQGRYAGYVYRSESNMADPVDADQRTLIAALKASGSRYRLAAAIKLSSYSPDHWYFWTRVR